MATLYFLGLFLCFLNRSDAIRCFQCQYVTLPSDCTKILECSADEHCFTEQVVTSAGSFRFNSGCVRNTNCPPTGISLIGKRATNSKRSADITTCYECCKDEFCNKIGCGTTEIPLAQRGPYCFTCDAATDAKSCSDVTVCGKNEVCMLYSPVEYDGLPQTIYKGQCESQSVCDVVTKALSYHKCAPMCCNTDFCNDHCSIPSMTTAYQQTTLQATQTSEILTSHAAPTQQPTKATDRPTRPSGTAHFHCHIPYIHIWNANTQLCVHIVHMHSTWEHARHACKQEGADLVVLDTHEKALLMRSKLAASEQNSFWIGMRDFNRNDRFLWVNYHTVDYSKADWDHGQPDHYHYNEEQNCVMMTSNSYRWHDANCHISRYYYICERR
ncbi:uncharacterized protein LOC123532998 isoform X1 [Mercenaria mercenaria]|uniref:uncharacterized protein LOC123532998 isoform X1 n=1 Tax=Mercenaria mercenaria TaxID=6596 RepID=UPI00234F25D7|nr:uncharacterized protein LOC123532998 isoform X1 [Mercenaria mercenaria]